MNRAPSRSRPWLALALTFTLLGVGFSNPFQLVTHFPPDIWEGSLSWEILNLYALTTFGGLAHFIYAWQGQWSSASRLPSRSRLLYWLAIAVLFAIILAVRSLLGVAIFSLAVWTYNIAHFIRAEGYFAGGNKQRGAARMPALAFAWFTLSLFQVGPLQSLHVVLAGSVLLAAVGLWRGGWTSLANAESPMPLLTFFFLGETMLWAGYSPYMSPSFRVGIYVLHIAAASFFHYLGSYFYAPQNRKMIHPLAILGINIAIILMGVLVDRVPGLHPLSYVFGVEWFTFWVALHLISSDLLPWWKRSSVAGPQLGTEATSQ